MGRFVLILLLTLLVFQHRTIGQARLILNGAFVNIENGAQLVIDNSNPNAITRNSGHIISEDEDDIVRWNFADNAGNYTLPFGIGTTEYLPLSFGTLNAIGPNGYFEFATYGRPNYLNSSYLPTGVSNFTGFSGPDNSPYVVDRFWKIGARNYAGSNTDKPDIENIRFTYKDPEHLQIGNSINENTLWIQRYNPVLDSWYDYIPGNGVVAVNTAANTVEAAIVPYDEVYDWWVLVDQISPLPIELLTFTAKPVNNTFVQLDWATANESNSDKFIVERSLNGTDWEYVLTKKAAGQSNTTLQYNDIDPQPYTGISYYRLKLLDVDASYQYSQIQTVFIEGAGEVSTLLYPNPTADIVFLKAEGDLTGEHQLNVFDVHGRLVMSKNVTSQDLMGSVPLNVKKLAAGTYFLQVQGETLPVQAFKFMKFN
jgi:Secretion system C-terminal sorting domain